MVSIAAFQAVDPGSIPGRRIHFLNLKFFDFYIWIRFMNGLWHARV